MSVLRDVFEIVVPNDWNEYVQKIVQIYIISIIVKTQNMVQVLAKRNMLGDLVTCKKLN